MLPLVLRFDSEAGYWDACVIPLGIVTRHRSSGGAVDALARLVDMTLSAAIAGGRDPFRQSHRIPLWVEQLWNAVGGCALIPVQLNRMRGKVNVAFGALIVQRGRTLRNDTKTVLVGGAMWRLSSFDE